MQANQNQNQGGGQNQSGGQSKPTLSWSATSAQNKPVAQKPAPMTTKPMLEPRESRMGTYIGIFVAGLIVGVLVGWGVAGTREGASSVATTATTTTTTSATTDMQTSSTTSMGETVMPAANGPFSVADQNAGLNVQVSGVDVSKPTWIVIYESRNGIPGNALGAHLFFPASAGGATSGTVDLLRGTSAGQTYFAGEALDDGDHIFSMENDMPVRDSKGNPVWVSFKAL